MTDNIKNKEVWLWNANLAWELFSTGVWNYRLSIKEAGGHKQHAYYKLVIFCMSASVEAFCNQTLSKQKEWSEQQLGENLPSKLKELGVDYENSKFKNSRFVRNNLLEHYKLSDHRYFVGINSKSALEAIESSQEIIADISFKQDTIFPYWITGLNFVQNNDIGLLNDYQFWRNLKQLNISAKVGQMVKVNGLISPPKD